MRMSFYTHSLDEIIAEAKKYKYRSDFQKAHPGVYTTLTRRKLVDKVCAHMEAKPRATLCPESIALKIQSYKYREDLQRENPELFQQAYRFKIPLPPLKEVKRCKQHFCPNWNYSDAEALIPKYPQLSQFIIHESSLVNWLRKNNLYAKFKTDHQNYYYVSDDQIIFLAQQYKTKTEIKYSKKEPFNLWFEISKRGLQTKAFAHLENGYLLKYKEVRQETAKYTKKQIFADCILHISLTKWRKNSPLIYRAAQERNLIMICKEKIRLNNKRNKVNFSNDIRYENNVIHPRIMNVLKRLKIPYQHEKSIGSGSRPDFIININKKVFILEAKSDKADSGNKSVSKQIERYKNLAQLKYQDGFGGVLLISDHSSHLKIGAIPLTHLTRTLKSYQQGLN